MSAAGNKIRVAVIGAGDFGRNHIRVYRELPNVELAGIIDTNSERAQKVAAEFGCAVIPSLAELRSRAVAVSVTVPTTEHARVGCEVLSTGLDALVEKPIASSLDEADALVAAAQKHGRILQIGHVERFNPAVLAAEKLIERPLFFEVHRLGVFSARSLDIDVIFDVMIHDLDILLALVGEPVTDVKAVGIPVLTGKVDIAHARLEFESGAVANVTASRVSTERVRKMRFFQSHEYISLDFARRDVLRVRVAQPGPNPEFGYEKVPASDREPLRAELEAFIDSVQTRRQPRVDGRAGRAALALATQVAASIQEHGQRVQLTAFAVSRSDSK
jgi:predicted dehydrogenase